jgi:hypothetical protein
VTIDTSGNVGIGTASPSARLDLQGTSTLSTGTTFKAKNSTASQNTVILDNGYVGIGTTAPASKLELWGIGTTSASNALQIKDSAGTAKVTFRDDGNVGIGTTAPDYKLDVRGANPIYANIQSDGATAGFQLTSSTRVWTFKTNTNDFIIRDVSAGADRFFIKNDGNVGIGTTAPSSILHINDASTTTDGLYIEKTSALNKTALDVHHKTSVATRTIAKFRNLSATAFEILGDGQINAPLGNIYFGSGFSGQTVGKINVDFGAGVSGTALSLKGSGPAIVQTIHRTTGTSSAVPLSRIQYTNDVTTNQQIAEFGVLASNNIGGTPQLQYMYMNPFATSSAWSDATLKVDFENRVGIGLTGTTRPTETLEVDGNLFLNGNNDKIYLGADKDEYLEYDPTLDGIQTAGKFKAGSFVSSDGTAGITTTFVDGDGNTIGVKDGLIVSKTAP